MFDAAKKIKNSYKVMDLLGKWPSFHDAEVIKVELDRKEPSLEIRLYTFMMLKEVDEKGHYRLDKQCIVTFRFSSIQKLKLVDFNQQNVISGLSFEETDKGIEVEIGSCYGLNGEFICKDIKIVSVEEINKTIV